MKRLLIVVPSFNIGGTVTALVNFVTLIDRTHYEVFVYSINKEGLMLDQLSKLATIVGYSNMRISPQWKLTINIIIFKLLKKVYKYLKKIGLDLSTISLRRIARNLEKKDYDLVIAFQEGTATKLVGFFRNQNKFAWVRSEYSRYTGLARIKPEVDLYKKFKKIICVSIASSNNFIGCIPEVKEHVVHIYDILNAERILSLSQDAVEIDANDNTFAIISIGRVDPVKRFSLIPQIAASLKKQGLIFKWYILGSASVQTIREEQLLKANISKYDVSDDVILLGQKSNPYPYLKRSNLLVCLSSSETFNYTLTEAKILGVPIVTTNYACAAESVVNNEQGLIVSIENIEDAIFTMITDHGKYDTIRENLKRYKYNCEPILNDIYKILN